MTRRTRLLTLLVLLTAAATGAWADVTWSLNNGTLTISGTGAMDNYVSVSDVPWYSSAELITSVNIGSGVTTIGNNAFADCISLATIDIPDGVTTIGNGAFYGCRALANVTIGSGVTTIGDYAFSACKSLVTIDIPDGVTTIGKYVFYDSINLANVNIGSGMTSIGGYAFSECFALTAIDIPAGVTTIGNSTFYMCSELKDVIIPNGVTTIDDYAFVYCEKLESIIIPSSVTSIGDYAFKYSATLSDVFVLATTPATLGTQAFNMTASDFKIYVPAASVNEYKTKWSDYAGKILANPYYTVALADGTKDKFSWQGKVGDGSYGNLPIKKLDGGETITLKYNGRRKVKSVTATTDANPLATPLTIEAVTPGTIVVDMSDNLPTGMQYSVNGGTKIVIKTTTSIEGLKAGDKVQFYGNGTQTQVYGDYPEVSILGSGDGFQTKVYGNIMSLVDEEGFATKTDLPDANFVFYGLFKKNATLIDASELLLPAATLQEGCYQQMFENCTSLTKAPKLPATTLAAWCYLSMFNGCKKLATVTCLATSGINQNGSTSNWLNDAGKEAVGTKTFNAVSNAIWPSGVDGIPTGWTRVNIDN